YADRVVAALQARGIRAESDKRNEKINYKVREHSDAHVPAILAVGRQEVEAGTVSVRRLGEKGQKVVPLEEAIAALVDEATPPDLRRALSSDKAA
ncbi:MAG: His/Gly/Thr/Pro-type tRNA ligase C-terminal domain-containing protein, partial [Pseudomonadota bacterium]